MPGTFAISAATSCVSHIPYCSLREIERDSTCPGVAFLFTKEHAVYDEAELILVKGISPETLALRMQLGKAGTSSCQLVATKGSHHA